jgi:hypothetical protein
MGRLRRVFKTSLSFTHEECWTAETSQARFSFFHLEKKECWTAEASLPPMGYMKIMLGSDLWALWAGKLNQTKPNFFPFFVSRFHLLAL